MLHAALRRESVGVRHADNLPVGDQVRVFADGAGKASIIAQP